MRIPLRKIYRAFPEFDRFSDDRCEQYMRRVRATSSMYRWLVGIGGLTAMPVAFAAYLFLALPLQSMIPSATMRRFDAMWLGVASFGDVVVASPAIGAMLLALGLTALARDTALRLALRKNIDRAVCPRCGQSLLGLPIAGEQENPSVRCPECGTEHVLARIGLSPADVMARDATATWRA